MKISYVSFGQHVKSLSSMRLGERYVGLGTCQSMECKNGLLIAEIKSDDKVDVLAIPMANIAFMSVIAESKPV